jgi:hypothetical protein
MTHLAPALRAPTAHDLDHFAATHHDAPWLAACWVETDASGVERLRWTLDPAAAPPCARTHLLAGRVVMRDTTPPARRRRPIAVRARRVA